MNSTDLLKLKNDTKCILLNEAIVSTILGFFILHNTKIQGKKNLNENKIIMIMNKISHNNINELVKEYLSIITINTVEEYNIIQQEILCKLVKDISFIDNYIPFIIKIFSIEKYRLSLEPIYFITNLDNKIRNNYSIDINVDISQQIETERLSYLQVMTKLILFKFFTLDLYDYISNIILSQNMFKIDVYYWFNDNKHLLKKYTLIGKIVN